MRIFALLAVLPLLAVAVGRTPIPKTYDTHAYYTLELGPHSTFDLASSVASSLGVELVEQLGQLSDHYVVRCPGHTPHHTPISESKSASHSALTARSAIVSTDQDPVLRRWHELRKSSKRETNPIKRVTPLSLRQRAKRDGSNLDLDFGLYPNTTLSRRDDTEFKLATDQLGIHDPILDKQWHLINQELPEFELNVTGLWKRGVTGKGVKVAMIDDGLDFHSEDLKANFYAEGSYDFNDHTELPEPRLFDDQHGTRCAGEIAAVKNDVCGIGVAYEAKVAGLRILSGPITDVDEAASLNYAYQENDIYSCSWGPPDDGRSMEAPEYVILKAIVNGVHEGRGGKGNIYVFAAGNGGGADDQCNFDGYTNSIFSITVGAIDRKGLHPYYSEPCAAMMIVAPSSGSGDHIHTTDVGEKKCTSGHGGTSAAAPLAAGVFALALQVRPDLSWRDMQHVAVRSAVHFNKDDPDWEVTAEGRPYSYKYGFGRIDAGLFVEEAERHKVVKPQAWFDSPAVYLPTTSRPLVRRQESEPPAEPTENPEPAVPEPSGSHITEDGVKSTFEVTASMLEGANFEKLEHVTVRVWIDHDRRGDVAIELISPKGIRSVLTKVRPFDADSDGYPGWKLMSLKHWGEDAVGTWTIKVSDAYNPEQTGRFVAWSLQLWGECVDPALAKKWWPAEEGQPDEEETGTKPKTTQKLKPTAHLPSDHGQATGEATKPFTATTTATVDGDIAEPTTSSASLTAGADEGFFNGIESLGSSSTWMAGAGMIIVLAGAGTGAFFYFRARRRRRNLFGLANGGEGARGAYAPVGDDVPMGLIERGRRKLGGGRGGEQGGSKELYDAFGDGPSDSEDEDEVGEPTALRYHDEFLGDDGEEEDDEDENAEASRELGGYKDDVEGEGGHESRPESPRKQASGSSGSWEDAGEEVGSSST